MTHLTVSRHPYYSEKISTLAGIFGADVSLTPNSLMVGDAEYPIIDDVIVVLARHKWPASLVSKAEQLRRTQDGAGLRIDDEFAPDIQAGFGQEWQEYEDILPEHALEFRSYFDLVDLDQLADSRVCDLGCGNGRWSHFVAPHCRELVLVDFSEAIFVARNNLRPAAHAVFVMADVSDLPFQQDAFNFAFCLGVLHHLPTPALDAVVKLAPLAKTLLVYLYYALDNRPSHERAILGAVTAARERLSKIHGATTRRVVAKGITAFVYLPLIALGHIAELFGRGHKVPLYKWYRGMSFHRIEQDAYDRFFTGIEQRVTRAQIVQELSTAFRSVVVSDQQPFWHFVCRRS